MRVPKIDLEILEHSRKMMKAKDSARKKHEFWEWLKDKGVDILAVIISLIALIRTF